MDDPNKLLYNNNTNYLSLNLFVDKGNKFNFVKIMRKLEDYEKENPPLKIERTVDFPNNIIFTSPLFDKFYFQPNYEFFPVYDKYEILKKYRSYSYFYFTFDESNIKDINFYKNYFLFKINISKGKEVIFIENLIQLIILM